MSAILYAIIKATSETVLAFLERLARANTVASDAQTPVSIRDRFRAAMDERLRKQSGDGGQQK